MKAATKKALKTVAVVIILIIVVILLIICFKRDRDNTDNLNDIFGQEINIKEFPQISDIYDLQSLAEFRSYNPCIFKVDGDDHPYYAYRLCNFTLCPGGKHKWNSDYRERTKSHTIIENPQKELFIVTHPVISQPKCEQGCEDARTIVIKDRLYLFCNATAGENCRREMVMMELNLNEFRLKPDLLQSNDKLGKKKRTHIKEISPLSMVKLKTNLDSNRDQKNWMPLVIDDQLYFIYSVNPHVILKYTGPLKQRNNGFDINDSEKLDKINCVEIARTSNPKLPDNLRGGSQIIKVRRWNLVFDPKINSLKKKYLAEDLYLGLVHTRDSLFQYSTYFYAFETFSPYNVRYITKPFIFGENASHSKRIQFASGLCRVVRNEPKPIAYLYITYGENDCTGKLCILKEEDVLHALQEI